VDAIIRQYNDATIGVNIGSVNLAYALRKLFGGESEGISHTGSHNKKMPTWMIYLPDYLQKSLLDALFEGDGYIDTYKGANWRTFSTSSAYLAEQVRIIALRLGYYPFSGEPYKGMYRIRLNKSPRGVRFGSNGRQSSKRYAFLPVRKVELEPYSGKVYNLEVDKHNTYSIPVIVHNCEKNSMGFVIEPACRKYQACYQPLVGQSSIEKVNMAVERALKAARAGKKVRLFYIADWDRYGWGMVTAVARKIEFMVEGHDMDIKLTRLALNDDQIEQYQLPKAPKHGEAVVELDALEAIYPGELGKLVEQALKPYYDEEKPKMVEAENRKVRERARQLLEEKLRKPLEEAFKELDLEGIANGFSLTEALDENFQPPEPGHEVQESTEWVLDTTLDYWEQLELYRKYKGAREEEVTDE